MKIITFRDVYADDEPFQESRFFIFQENDQRDEVAFCNYISNICTDGGEDEPESALEALHLAMNVDYVQPLRGQKARHIIVLITDASAHALNDPRRSESGYSIRYPQGVPADLTGLQAEWEERMDSRSKRLVIFAPNAYPWSALATWYAVVHAPLKEGNGIGEDVLESVIATIAGGV